MHRRGTFLRTSGPPEDITRKHLHVSLTNPFGPASQVLCTSIASIRSTRYDDSCILAPGDHEFIEHHSYVVYRHSVLLENSRIESCIESGEYAAREDVSQDLLDRILDGVYASTQCPRFVRDILDRHG